MSQNRYCLFILLYFGFGAAGITWHPLNAQVIDEPDPFIVIGEKPGDPAERPEAGAQEPDKTGKPDSGEGPAPLSAQISQHILKLAEAERDKRLDFMKVVIDDVVRLCKLDAGQRERLELAAKGTSERSMKVWHEQAERHFRTRLESAEGDTAMEMLEGMGSFPFGGNRSEEEGESLALWKDSLKDVLTDEQVSSYDAVLEQRHLDRVDAFARMSISTIDGHLRLTPDQKAKMEDVVQASAATYLNEVQAYWGDYFERGMLMSLANAAEEETLKAILTDQQFNRLKEATSNFDHFWNDKRQKKRAKEKAAERRKSKGGEEAPPEKEAAPAAGKSEKGEES